MRRTSSVSGLSQPRWPVFWAVNQIGSSAVWVAQATSWGWEPPGTAYSRIVTGGVIAAAAGAPRITAAMAPAVVASALRRFIMEHRPTR
jgi:hypothetical protein